MGSDAHGSFNSADLRDHQDRLRFADGLRLMLAANDNTEGHRPDAPDDSPVEARLRRQG